ncbi:Metallo-dependent phosphatase-like protein [Lipomyces arxii]|uniref:Metallo-dependent phosphatase-like protein n=1 Tax=Lipomyces arxii TaxID=56418 RepID=UPI0034CD8248
MSSRIFILCRRLLRSRLLVIFALSVSLLLLFGNRSAAISSTASDILSAWTQLQSDDQPTDKFRESLPDVLITDIRTKSCVLVLKPLSGSWCEIQDYKRIEKELSLGQSWLSRSYVFVREQPKADVQPMDTVVLDLHIGPSSPLAAIADTRPARLIGREDLEHITKTSAAGQAEESDSQVDDKGDWVLRSSNLWIKLGHPTDFAVSDVDVLYGVDAVDPRFGWFLKGDKTNSLVFGSEAHPRITIRFGGTQDYPIPRLRLNDQNKFKIIQLADLHFSTGVGRCLNVYPEDTAKDCQADPRTLAFINRVLDDERPDFAVLTGDEIFGDASPDAQSALLKATAPLIERKIPFAVTFGNHDDEGNLSRNDLMQIASQLPYSASQPGPEFAKGVGNYYLNVLANKEDHAALTLYLLDTHKYSPNPKKMPGYNWIDESQLEFLVASYRQLSPLRSEYTTPKMASTSNKKHMSMAFFHIPLTEYRNTSNPFVGSYREPSTAPKYNTGARSVLEEIGVSVVSVGHDHVNDFCMFDRSYSNSAYFKQHKAEFDIDKNEKLRKHKRELGPATNLEDDHGIWLCHGGGAGLGGYGGYGGYIRRLRLFEIDTNEASIVTWKRLEYGTERELLGRVDLQKLVENGKVKN